MKDVSSNLVGGFVLESILPYNKLTSGEFCIKRVGDNTGTALTYLGDEKTVSETNKKATNYVIDPWTSGKNTGSTPSGLTYNVRKLMMQVGHLLRIPSCPESFRNSKSFLRS